MKVVTKGVKEKVSEKKSIEVVDDGRRRNRIPRGNPQKGKRPLGSQSQIFPGLAPGKERNDGN